MSIATRRILSILDRAGPHYLGLILAGISGIAWPPHSLEQIALYPIAIWFWLGSLIIGGALCAIGRWSHLVKLKIIGLSLVLVAMGTILLTLSGRLPQGAPGFCLLMSLASLLGYRLRSARRTRDARLAVRRGSVSGPDLATYARDSLARRRHHRSWNSGGPLVGREDEAGELGGSAYGEPNSAAPRYGQPGSPSPGDDRGDRAG